MPSIDDLQTARAACGPKGPAGEQLLEEGRGADRAGRLLEAARAYEAAVERSTAEGSRRVLAEALRRLGVVRQRRQEGEAARALCQRSYDVAMEAGDAVLAAEALNTLAAFDLERGEIDLARKEFLRALDLGGMSSATLRGRIEQNLGVISNIRGDLDAGLLHYRRSLEAYEQAGDERGCAMAHHNLGMISADRQLWHEAEEHYRMSLQFAESADDVHIRGLCLLNRCEVLIARGRHERARLSAEEALRVFDQLGVLRNKADAYKMLGIVYRETGKPALAEARLRTAIDLAVQTGAMLSEAESSRELAILYQFQGRNQDVLKLLTASHRLFGRLNARVEMVDVAAKRAQLEGIYLEVVREWGQSIESSDSYTFGHCDRVAAFAVAVGRAMGLDDADLTTLRMGAYLHDLGKVRVPHEVLNKPGRLTQEEFELMKLHPVYGVEMLAGVEFPWDIKPIIRWHHEKYDGTGYPDRLKGDEIPLTAQIACVVDVYDALTTTRSYRTAMTREAAVAEMTRTRDWWRPDVFKTFLATIGAGTGVSAAA
ncbi:MAG TPA: HD domain-containing phosphohydrolase [Gemmatimonadaceae bacterium]|nr:HD domain-containing phosphohydrolase [Gemmatimonadaceae bacterium]